MRKKALALALGILLTAQAMAAETPMKTYRGPEGSYEISYPASWRMIDQDSIVPLLDEMARGETRVAGVSLEAMQQYQTYMLLTPMVLFIQDETGDNFYLYYVEDPTNITTTTRQALAQMREGLGEQLQTLYPDYQALDPGSMVTQGEQAYAHLSGSATIDGAKSRQHLFILLKGLRMYTLVFTFRQAEGELAGDMTDIMNQVAESFRPG